MRRRFGLGLFLVVVIAVGLTQLHGRADAPAPAHGHNRGSGLAARRGGPAEAALIGGGRTCAWSSTSRTPTSPAQCRAWIPSGPVNIVVVSRHGDPAQILAELWKPAQGRWLVAEAQLLAPGCGGWTASTTQLEQRVDSLTRRHLKLINADCAFPGSRAVVADVHTDVYDPRHCGGDRMADMNAARDALVGRLAGLPGASVKWVQLRDPGRVPGGCHTWVPDDGRAAVVTLG